MYKHSFTGKVSICRQISGFFKKKLKCSKKGKKTFNQLAQATFKQWTKYFSSTQQIRYYTICNSKNSNSLSLQLYERDAIRLLINSKGCPNGINPVAEIQSKFYGTQQSQLAGVHQLAYNSFLIGRAGTDPNVWPSTHS